jgi:hypothetical protein
LINILQYLYYHSYIWLLRKWGKNEDPKNTALLGLASTLYINLASIPMVIEQLTGEELIDLKTLTKFNNNKWVLVILTIIYLIAFYVFLIYKGKFKKILEKYKNESASDLKKGILITWIYIIGSYLIFFESLRMFF